MKTRRREEEEVSPWELVLPWLPPPDLAATTATCRSIHRLSAAVTGRRASDASRGLERRPIPFRSPAGSTSLPYACFLYTPHPVAADDRLFPTDPFSCPWGGELNRSTSGSSYPFAALAACAGSGGCGCGCGEGEEGCCDPNKGCPCGFLSPDFLGSGAAAAGVMTECGPGCRCGPACGNRRTQGGVSAALEVVWDGRKGWGLHAARLIPKGGFICEYAGEYLTTEEARRRQKIYDKLAAGGTFSPALLVLREHLPSGKACLRINIDATMLGNVARFINHSCDGGNLLTVLMRCSGSLLPRLCFFAARHILEDEELTFSYGETRVKTGGPVCFCGSPNCHRVLPSEET